MPVDVTQIVPGMRVRVGGEREYIVIAACDGPTRVLLSNDVIVDAGKITELLGPVDMTEWRAVGPDEAVRQGTLVTSNTGRLSMADTDTAPGTHTRCSVTAGWFDWDGLRVDPSGIRRAPTRPGELVRISGAVGRVKYAMPVRGAWRITFDNGREAVVHEDTDDAVEHLPDGTTVCKYCGAVRLPDDDDDDDWEHDDVCPGCAADCFECAHCGTLIHTLQAHDVDDELWCESCRARYAARCAHCDGVYPTDVLENGVCPSCMDSVVECDECGWETELRYAHGWEHDGDTWTCPDCAAASGTIKNYGYKPRARFHGGGGVFYGVELEVDGNGESDSRAARIMDGNEFWYAKHDGSLSNGFEVVSHPGSLSYHLNEAGWSDLLQRALDEGYRSHDARTCGLHVHISREAFEDGNGQEDAALARLLLIFDMHWSKLLRFSRRTQAQCDDWAQRYSMTRPHNDTEAARACREFKSENGGSRYYAVNLQNDNTVELRMFRGTLNEETFFATLEMADALRRIATETTTAELVGLTWSAMRRRWFNTYDHLPGYLDRRFGDEPQVEEEEEEELPEDEVLPDGDEVVPDEVLPDGDGATLEDGTVWMRCTEIPEPGTRVRIRQWDDMAAEYGANDGLGIATPGALFHRDMRPMCGNVYTVPQYHGHNSFSTGGWTITPEMIEREATWQRCAEMPAPGTPIRIRQWDDMAAEFGVRDGYSIRCAAGFTDGMRTLCGDVFATPYLRTISGYVSYRGWSISPDMIERAV